MTLGIDDLLAFQRSEFHKAARLRNGVIVAQFMVALPGAASVLVEDGVLLYFLAIAAGALLIAWLILDWLYRNHRETGEKARKATLLTYGLGEHLSASELLALESAFPERGSSPRQVKVGSHFATRQPAGLKRVSEMLEESAFWSSDLHRGSAIAMGAFFLVLLVISVVAAAVVLPFTKTSTLMTVVRMSLALLVFALSSDILGAVRGHWKASVEVGDLVGRLQKVAEAGYPTADVLFLTFEYNSAVEGAPVVVPLVYSVRKNRLNQLWKGYQATRLNPP